MSILFILIGIVAVIDIGYFVGKKLGFYGVDETEEEQSAYLVALEEAGKFFDMVGERLSDKVDDQNDKAKMGVVVSPEEISDMHDMVLEFARLPVETVIETILSGKPASSTLSEKLRKFLEL